MEQDVPIAYTAIAVGTPVLTGAGRQIGTVEHVLEVPELDLFEGIAITTEAGLRFLDSDQVGTITADRIVCTLSDDQVAALPAPDGAPIFRVDALEDTGDTLHDRVGRLFGRGHWKQEGS
jgi:hypothetical protein